MGQPDSSSVKLTAFLSEPLTLFVLVAAVIFALDALRGGPELEDPNAADEVTVAVNQQLTTIVVSDAIVAQIVDDFRWLEGALPTSEQTSQLVRNWLDEELVFREAIVNEMYMNDGKMREHFVEKIRLMWAGVPDDPTEMELLTYYMDNLSEYYSEPRVSFTQIFYTEEPNDPAEILTSLQKGEQVEGDRYWLGDTMNNYAESILRTSFGGDFYSALTSASTDEWFGPLASPRGFHFVKVTAGMDAAPLAYENIRLRVAQDWLNAENFARVRERTAELNDRYTIIVETDAVTADDLERQHD